MTAPTLDQYAPGGCFKQLSDAAGGNDGLYQQYMPGGPPERLRVLIDPTMVLDQRAPGGPVGQAVTKLSGPSVPAWVPDDAKIHIDLVGGTPQGRAWVDGTGEVAMNTLLGTDPNTETGWYIATVYNPANLTSNGYTTPDFYPPALIGAVRTFVLAAGGFTARVLFKNIVVATASSPNPLVLMSADGEDGINIVFQASISARVRGASTGGPISVISNSVLNLIVGSLNCVAVTMAGSRYQQAANGSVVATGTIGAADRPAGNPFVATLIDPINQAIQSVTIYDPLPSAAGLSELSQV